MFTTTIRRMPADKYISLVTKIVELRRAGLTYAEVDEKLGDGVKSRRWMQGPKTRKFAKQLGA